MAQTLEQVRKELVDDYDGPCSGENHIDLKHGIVFIPSQHGNRARLEHLTATRMGLADVVKYIRRVHDSSADRHVASELERILEELEQQCPHCSQAWR